MGVTSKFPNRPMMLMQAPPNAVDQDLLMFITGFTPGAPPAPTFTVPPNCGSPSVGQQFIKNADHPSQIMPPFMMDPTGEAFKKMIDLGKH